MDIGPLFRGIFAKTMLLRAFLDSTDESHFMFEIGVLKEQPDEILVLVEIDGTKGLFTPFELRVMGGEIVDNLPRAASSGVPDGDIENMRWLAAELIENAKAAAVFSPHGMH
jgi:hypothetical protein